MATADEAAAARLEQILAAWDSDPCIDEFDLTLGLPTAVVCVEHKLGVDFAVAAAVLVVMAPVTADLLKSYRDMGVDRCNIGVGMENWGKPEIVMPMIEQFSKIIPDL